MVRKLPIGIQNFEQLRTEGYLYVDKTELVYNLAQLSTPYFLSRPRRFGKSLLISTLRAYFEGKKELFEGLAIAKLEKEWVEFPVLHIDLSGIKYENIEILQWKLLSSLAQFEQKWKIHSESPTAAAKFADLLYLAHEKTGKKVAVLIDEYDQPLLETMDEPERHEDYIKELRAFYGVLKGSGLYLKFLLITGISKFAKLSIFSQMNQLRDISMVDKYAGLCGITEQELIDNFQSELDSLAKEENSTYNETLDKMRKFYNGYHFSSKGESVYTPWSVLNTFENKTFGNYWFKNGTPYFLFKLVKDREIDLRNFDEGTATSVRALDDYRIHDPNPFPVLFQTGYLTFKELDMSHGLAILCFPNDEVRLGFLGDLLNVYAPQSIDGGEFFVYNFAQDLKKNDVESFMKRMKALLASIAYPSGKKRTAKANEHFFQSIYYMLFRLIGEYAATETRSSTGRADLVVTMPNAVYVFEFKMQGAGTAEDALKQIDDKGYLIPYSAGFKKLVKIGVAFDGKHKTLGKWVVDANCKINPKNTETYF